jgi:polar amino acid transport system permease protein
VYLIIAAIYFSLCYPLSSWSKRLELRGAAARQGSAPAPAQPAGLSVI